MRFANPLADLKPDDRARFRYSLAAFVCVASAALVARTAGDALFLSRYGAGLLSYMYVGTAGVVIVASYVLGTLSSKLPVSRLIQWSCVALCLLLLGLRTLLPFYGGASSIAAYLMADLVVNVPMILFWSHTALLFNPREAKRLFGFIGAGGTAGCIAAGLAVPHLSAAFGTSGLLLAVAGLLLGFLFFTRRIAAIDPERVASPARPGRGAGNVRKATFLQGLWRVPQLRNLLAMAVVASVTLTLVDFQFKAAARAHMPASALAAYFGSFYGYASVLALLIQLLAVHRILRSGGVFVGLSLLPIGLLAAAAGTAISGAFIWTMSMKFVVQVLFFTVDIAAVQMLYLGIPPQSRSQARAFVDGIARPAAMAATGAALVALVAVAAPRALPVAVALGAVAWLVLARRSHGSYVTALVGSLEKHSYDPSRDIAHYRDEDFQTHLREALSTAPDDDIVYLLQIMEEMPQADWSAEYRQLLSRDSIAVKSAALGYLGRHGSQEDLESILAHQTHPDDSVRAKAVAATAVVGKHTVVEDIQAALEDPSPAVRGAAVAGLVNAGDLDGLLAAGAVLRDLLASDDPQARISAARALGQVENRGLVRPLIGLLEDPDAAVVAAAMEACRRRGDPQLIPALLLLLAQPEIAAQAAQTLSTFGKAALPHLLPYLQLGDTEGSFEGAHRIPDILAEIGDPASLPALYERILDPIDPALQEAAVAAYCRLVRTQGLAKAHEKSIERAVEAKLSEAEALNRHRRNVVDIQGAEILNDALLHERNSRLRSAFGLLGLTTRGVDMAAVYAGVSAAPGAARANALEILDNVLKGDTKARLLAILEPSREQPAAGHNGLACVEALLASRSADWVTIGAAYTVAQNGWGEARAGLMGLLEHPNAAIRETALYALGQLGIDSDLVPFLEALSGDPDPTVRTQALALLPSKTEGHQTS
jgi:HEAT repeat protein/ATP/ADP translocase